MQEQQPILISTSQIAKGIEFLSNGTSIAGNSNSNNSGYHFSNAIVGGMVIVGFIFAFGVCVFLRYRVRPVSLTFKFDFNKERKTRNLELKSLGTLSQASTVTTEAESIGTKSLNSSKALSVQHPDLETGLGPSSRSQKSIQIGKSHTLVEEKKEEHRIGEEDDRASNHSSLADSLTDEVRPTSHREFYAPHLRNSEQVRLSNKNIGIAFITPTSSFRSPLGSPVFDGQSNRFSCDYVAQPEQDFILSAEKERKNKRGGSNSRQIRFLVDDMMHRPIFGDEDEEGGGEFKQFSKDEYDNTISFSIEHVDTNQGYMSLKTTSSDDAGIWIKLKDNCDGVVYPVAQNQTKQIIK
jgi:hypothetical protein